MMVRRADVRDIGEMMRIRAAVRENRLVTMVIGPDAYKARLDGDYATWVAVDDAAAVMGFASADRLRANVWALFVDPACEQRGVGRELHDVMMDWLFDGVDHAWLTTEASTRAETFYRAAGWVVAGTEATGELRFEMTRDAWKQR